MGLKRAATSRGLATSRLSHREQLTSHGIGESMFCQIFITKIEPDKILIRLHSYCYHVIDRSIKFSQNHICLLFTKNALD